jgi:PST family polysaccharide transporter
LLSPFDFGLLALASIYVTIAQTLVSAGFPELVVQREELTDLFASTAFWTNLAIAVVFVLATMLIAPLMASLFGAPKLAPILEALSSLFVIGALGATHEARLRRGFNFRPLAIRATVGAAVGGVVGIGAALQGYGVWSLVAQLLASAIVQTALVWVAARWTPRLHVDLSELSSMFRFGLSILSSRLLTVLETRVQDAIIGLVLGVSAVGYYRIAWRGQEIMTQLTVRPISAIALPTFSHLQRDPSKLRTAYVNMCHLVGIFLFPLFIGSALVSPDLIPFVFGDKWDNSIVVFQILCGNVFVYTLFYLYDPVLIAVGQTGTLLRNRILQTATSTAAVAIGAPFGLQAVAAAYVLRLVVIAPYFASGLTHAIGLTWRSLARAAVGPAVASVMMSLAIGTDYLLLHDKIGRLSYLAVAVISASITYTIAIFLLSKETRKLILEVLPHLPIYGRNNSTLKD